ncbi:MAG: site-specific integrase [Methanobrevibacter sp.]|nr:site-specific integrase [Methanobrevibacter sp.]
MYMNDEEILDDFVKSRNLKPISKKAYKASIKLYTEYHQMTLQDLIKEAEIEEDTGIRWKRRKLKRRLIDFRTFLAEKYLKNYAKNTFSRILTIYKHYEIEIHDLPPLSQKNFHQPNPISYKDLPDKDILGIALEISKPVMKAIILFMSSSGCARKETLNLTIQDFIDATIDYHTPPAQRKQNHTKNIYEVLEILKDHNDIVPTFKLRRQKTDKWYYTFCSPEATTEIINYLLQLTKPLTPETKLFQIHQSTFSTKFINMNTVMQLGKKGTYNRLRSHMLRKFHASRLKNDGMDKYDVNSMQGKGLNSTDEAYFLDDPEKLREKYIKHMACLTINLDINKIDIESPEFKQLKEMYKEKEAEVNNMKDRITNIEERLLEIDQRRYSKEELLEKISKKKLQ